MNVELRNIHKHFGKVHANNDITLNIPAGVIQGILGKVVPQVIQALKVSPDTQESLARLDIQDILGHKD